MKAGEWELDPAAIRRLLAEPAAAIVLEAKAHQVVNEAKATGPRGAHAGTHQIDLIAIGETHVTPEGVVVDIDWSSHIWHLLEFGSINNAPYRPISRAAQNNGLRVVDSHGGRA